MWIQRFIILLLLTTSLFANKDIKPKKIFNANGDVEDMVFNNNLLYVGTTSGEVNLFTLTNTKPIWSIKIPKIKDFTQETINAKIYSIDALSFDSKILFVSEGVGGYRDVWLFNGNKLEKIIGANQKLFIKKAKFVNNSTILLGLLSNQHILYDFKKKKILYTIQPTTSSFSNFTLSEDKKLFVTTDESGEVRIVNTLNGKIIKVFNQINLDRVFSLDFKKGVILTAGQDRRVGVYTQAEHYALNFDFLIYSASLNHNASLAGIAYNENNDIAVYNLLTKSKIFNLIGSKSTITAILFLKDNEIIASSEDKKINLWSIK